MKNKVELKKMLCICAIIVIVCTISCVLVTYIEYMEYTKVFNYKINAIVEKVLEEYQNISQNDVMQILNATSSDNINVLEKYNIDLTDGSIIYENELLYKKAIVLNVVLVIIAVSLLIAIFLMYNRRKDKNIAQITKYIEQINKKNYKLDIEENTEDELSILKNEIYKTTVMLKEVAQNSQKDKINLKNSLSDISHQLKTPLSSILVMLDNIIEDRNMDKEVQAEFIRNIKREIININFLVNSLLKLSKFDADVVEFTNTKVNIDDIVKEATLNVAALCDLKDVKIKVYEHSNFSIYCDYKWQIEAITNILKNCVEHSKQDSIVEIRLEDNKLYSKIDIKDYGTGIDREDSPHIFDRFYKGKNSAKNSVGIGLALAKSIIEKNNGYIEVNSKVGIGSTFSIKYFKN